MTRPSGPLRRTLNGPVSGLLTRAGLGRGESAMVAQSAGTLAVNLGALALNFIIALVLSNALGPEQYGVYSFALAWAMLLAVVALFGAPTLVTGRLAMHLARSEIGAARQLLRESTVRVMASSIAVAGLGALAGWATISADQPFQRSTFLIAMLLVPCIAAFRHAEAVMRGAGHVVAARLGETSVLPAALLGLLGLALVAGLDVGVTDAIEFHVAAAALTVAVAYGLTRRTRPKALGRAVRAPRSMSWIQQVRPFAVVSIVASLRAQLGVLMLGALAGVDAAGLFNAAQKLAMFTSFMLLVVAFPLGPAVARARAIDDQAALQRLFSTAGALIAAAAIPTGLALIVFGRQVLGLFGPEFVAARGVLTLLVVRELINAAAGAAGVALTMTGHEKVVARASVATVPVDLLLGVALIPSMGANGAAIAGIAGTLALNGWLASAVFLRLGVDPTVASARRLFRRVR